MNDRLQFPLEHCRRLRDEHKNQNFKLLQGYVYFVQSGPYIKIGKAKIVQRRINAFKTACPTEVTLLKSVHSNDCVKLENEWQSFFAQYRVRGEWFLIPEHLRQKLLSTPEEELLLGRLISI